jgi:pilus assembly protein CpaF
MVNLSEIVGMEGDMVTMQDLCLFKQTGVAPHGSILGEFTLTGVRPAFCERLESMGLGIDWAEISRSEISYEGLTNL